MDLRRKVLENISARGERSKERKKIFQGNSAEFAKLFTRKGQERKIEFSLRPIQNLIFPNPPYEIFDKVFFSWNKRDSSDLRKQANSAFLVVMMIENDNSYCIFPCRWINNKCSN